MTNQSPDGGFQVMGLPRYARNDGDFFNSLLVKCNLMPRVLPEAPASGAVGWFIQRRPNTESCHVYRTNTICIRGNHGHGDVIAGAVPQSELDLGYSFYRFQLFSEFIYRILSAKLADEKVWFKNRSGTGFGK